MEKTITKYKNFHYLLDSSLLGKVLGQHLLFLSRKDENETGHNISQRFHIYKCLIWGFPPRHMTEAEAFFNPDRSYHSAYLSLYGGFLRFLPSFTGHNPYRRFHLSIRPLMFGHEVPSTRTAQDLSH